MAETNSVFVKTSRYVAGGSTEVNAKAIEWWERDVVQRFDDDEAYVVDQKFEGRLDLITTLFLGEPRYWWVVAMYNNILDPHEEVVAGAVIHIPPLEKVRALFNRSTGGIPSKREVPTSILPIV